MVPMPVPTGNPARTASIGQQGVPMGSTPPGTAGPIPPSSLSSGGKHTTPSGLRQTSISGSGSGGSLRLRRMTSSGSAKTVAVEVPSQGLTRSDTIPKSESFVKIEGFSASPRSGGSGNESVAYSASSNGRSSLLTRELSLDNMQQKNTRQQEPSSSWSSSMMLPRTALPSLEPTPRSNASSLSAVATVPQSILVSLQEKYPVFKEPLVSRAFNISRLAHDGNYGGSHASSFEKCMSAAAILAELGADEVAVASALLYDYLDSTMLLESQLRPMLASDQTVDLVKRVSHISYICHRFKQSTPTNSMDLYEAAHEALPECLDLVGLMVAHGPPRALLVRLGVALGELRLCAAAVQENENMVNNDYVQSIARDAMTVWAPLANRLGVWSLKAELEDLGFSCLLPTQYTLLQKCLKKAQEPTALVGIVDSLRSSLHQESIDYVDLSGRPKHLWGVWCKMQKKGYSPERVQDVRGLRIIVRSREDCYKALRAVETSWKIVGPSKNYIKEPKKNGYQSLHVIADPGDGHSVEIQIRTDKMHYLAEYGADASHWKYKEGNSQIADTSVKLTRPCGEGLSCDLAKEANWAKFLTQQHVAVDKKCRPSGSPSEDKSLETIMAGLQEKAKASSKINNTAGVKKGKSFHEYIADSGQAVAPPEDSRVLVAVVHQGAFSVQSLPPGSSIADFLETREETHRGDASVQVLVNQQMESDSSTILQPGDVVELHMEPVHHEALVASKASKGNMLPLGNLSKKMTSASLV